MDSRTCTELVEVFESMTSEFKTVLLNSDFQVRVIDEIINIIKSGGLLNESY